MNKLSENLKKIRKDNNLSQEQLAEKLGVSRQAISKWESGSAYPEMDKILSLCNLFDLNIDDILNKDIRELKSEQDSKNNLNKYIDDFLNFITDTVNLFSNMNFKTKMKCLFEQLIIISILLITFIIIGGIGETIIYSIFFNWMPSNIYHIIYNFISGIYIILAFVIATIILLHIFKTRYLDYYKNLKENICKEDNTDKNEETTNKILFKENENKIIIRDPSHSEYKFIKGLFKLIIDFIKCFALLGVIPLCLMLVFFVACFIASFTIIKTGIFFVGLILSTLSLSIITIILILVLFNFIFNRKNDKKKMIWSFIISVIIFGISCGLIFIGSLQFDVVDDANKELLKTKSFEVDMIDNLTIDSQYKISYIEKDINNITVEYDINENCKLEYEIWDKYDKSVLHFWSYCPKGLEILRLGLSEINNNKIININSDVLNIKIYASKDNIEKLKTNKQEYEQNIKNTEETYEEYERRINELETELEGKQQEIYNLTEEINNYESN